ncbi:MULTISPECIES: adenylate/guanylate cyclase domain-containing protein [Sinorhizobium/Ensifer group]|uniref:adenylate/guanylate cyclase domain-containing protein n=1 Tax=Sinorhizobium/Ensifer group TaxID=227292 RepID=UPI00070C00E2|nr:MULTISPECIES: adenylate/guanylate cyclase domain-containing protein [Sinorhizobium/Ensifer group]KRD53241.1 cyclase [Ensifer sp. Root278]MBD9507033.1 adenylate/guanylate cyclase domain-containing protein [Ensifer sp. ENS10]MBV7517266.1 adenylate/guanylate cyclase domain-containing protein [Ensifer sp. ENS12]
MNWSRPLRVHLSVLVVALLICTATPIIWMAFSQGRAAAVLGGAKHMREMSFRLIEGYRNALEGGHEAVGLASAVPQLIPTPPAELEAKQQFFLEVLRSVSNATSIYAGYPDGSYVQVINTERDYVRQSLSAPAEANFAIRTITPRQGSQAQSTLQFLDRETRPIGEPRFEPTSFDPRQRPWYQAAVSSGAPVSVGPFVAGTLRVPTLALAAPMKGDHRVVVGVNIHLQTVSRLLDPREISPRARSFIIGDGDTIVAHSDPAIMGRILGTWSGGRAVDMGSLDMSVEAVARLRKDPRYANGGLAEIDLEGESYLAQVAPVSVDGLFKGSSVAIVVPLDDLVAQANRLLVRNLLIAAGLLVAGVFGSLMLSRVISQKLYRLADEARRIGDLNFTGKGVAHSWITEINTLGGALAASRRAIVQFALYVPREVVRRIIDPQGGAVVKGRRQEVTALFTDIRDFTTISEQHSPEDVVDILSAYFELLNGIAEEHGGTVVQYLGDSIFVVWNAPVEDIRHAEHGCRCALAMKAAVEGLNAANRQAGRPELFTRFGLHTGPAVVGSIGAASRQQYTAMGDTINVASRLEGLNKEFNTSILVSVAVHDAVARSFVFREIGLVQVKGRAAKIDLWELVGERGG